MNKQNFNKGTSSKNEDEEEEEEEEEEDDDDDLELDGSTQSDKRTFNTTVISYRLDVIGKTCFSISRAKFDEHFYDNLIRVNGERVGKKNHNIQEKDEIDLIKGFYMDNPERLVVNRVNILKTDDKATSGRFRISYLKTNKLVIDNYERDPYDGTLMCNRE